MNLVVYSSQPLDALQNQVETHFCAIRNRHLEPPRLKMPLLDPRKLGTLVYAQSERKQHSSLHMRWEIPYHLATDLVGRPAALITYALRQQGVGSLSSELKDQGLALSVCAEEQHELPGSALLQMQVALTDKGVADYEKVAYLCHAAIRQLQRHGITPQVFDDLVAAARRDHAFQRRQAAYQTVQKHALGLLEAPLTTYPDPLVAPTEVKPDGMAAVVKAMSPQACQYLLVAHPDVAKRRGSQLEPWLGVPYSAEPVPQPTLATWAAAQPPTAHFALPRANRFMPQELAVHPLGPNPPTEVSPRRLVDDPHMTVFAARDVHEHTPRVNWLIDILTPELTEPTAAAHVLRDLYLCGVDDALAQTRAEAAVAGMEACVLVCDGGLRVNISGYSHRAIALLEAVLSELKDSSLSRQRFADILEEGRHAHHDARRDRPFAHAMEDVDAVRCAYVLPLRVREAALQRVTYEDLQVFSRQIFRTNHVQASLMGNHSEEQLQAAVKALRRRICGRPHPVPQAPMTRLRGFPASPIRRERDLPCRDSGVLVVYEHGESTLTKWTQQALLLTVLHERLFDELRTKQQAGYMVGAMACNEGDQLYTQLLVQPHRHDVRDVLARIERFVEVFHGDVGKGVLDESSFTDLKAALLTRLREAPKSMAHSCVEMHALAFAQEGEFDFLEQHIAATQALTYEHFKAWVQATLGPKDRRWMAVMVRGTRTPDHTVVPPLGQQTGQLVDLAS